MSTEQSVNLDSVQSSELLKDVRSERPKGPSTRPKSTHILDSTPTIWNVNIDETIEPSDRILLPSMLRQKGGAQFAAHIDVALRKNFQLQNGERPKTMIPTTTATTTPDEVDTTMKTSNAANTIANNNENGATSNLKPTEIVRELKTQTQENATSMQAKKETNKAHFSSATLNNELVHFAKAIETIENSVNDLKLHLANLRLQLKQLE